MVEKPCSWHAEIVVRGRIRSVYCEAGPSGHEGGHIGERSLDEYMRRLRMWRVAQNPKRKVTDGNSTG